MFILSLDIQDNILPYTDGKTSHTCTETQRERETHTHTSEIEAIFHPRLHFLLQKIPTDSSPSTPRDSPLLACSLGKQKRWLETESGRRAGKIPTPACSFECVTIAFIFFTYSPELLVKKIIHCLPIVGTNESWLRLWDAGSLPGREGGQQDA